MGIAPDKVFDNHVMRLIKHKAARLSRHPALRAEDTSDLEQDLAVALLQRLPKYDDTRSGLHTFANCVIGSSAASKVRTAKTQRRSAPTSDRGALTDVEDVAADDQQLLNAPKRMDLHDQVDRLDNSLQPFARELMIDPPAAVIKRRGWTRGKFRHEQKRLAKHFRSLRPQCASAGGER